MECNGQLSQSHNYFTLSQSGLLKGSNCTTDLINVFKDLISKLDGNSVPFLVLLDHTKNFDTVDQIQNFQILPLI